METALGSTVSLVAYLALFAGVGFVFVFVNLLIGRFVRPSDPTAEKQEIYECGEPSIGSSFVQFDLRFYVVALVFIIFDVEVAFLFPWATVFGKVANLTHSRVEIVQVSAEGPHLSAAASGLLRELGVPDTLAAISQQSDASSINRAVVDATQLWMQQAMWAGAFFFVVLFVGFAYEWKTGALDWVRTIREEHRVRRTPGSKGGSARETVLSA